MMAKIQKLSELSQSFSFTEYDFYEHYRRTFENTVLGKMKKLLPLREMAENFGLVSKRRSPKRGPKPYFTPEGKVALAFLKMYTQTSAPKLMEQLNGNVHYQIFCGVRINPERPLTNYKLIDDILGELAGKMKIQQLQDLLAEAWKPYMKDLDTIYTDATCYESEMRYPTDQKLLWECNEKAYAVMCKASGWLGIHRPRTKYLDVERANMGYMKQRKHSRSQTRRIVRRRLQHCVKMHKRLFGVEVKKIGGDTSYAGKENRDFCKEKDIRTSFVKRGRPSKTAKEKDFVRQELARVRATTMEGSFGTQKEHYSMRRIKARKKETEILYIFFGIHTANAVLLAERLIEQQRAKAA